ncbi:hypothetical protein C7212DRAFT_181762, partial [Tuber magnatum]
LNPIKCSGRPKKLTPHQCQQPMDLTTRDSHSQRLPLATIAQMAGINAATYLPQKTFSQEGYHQRVARQKPFLNAVNKPGRLDCAN